MLMSIPQIIMNNKFSTKFPIVLKYIFLKALTNSKKLIANYGMSTEMEFKII